MRCHATPFPFVTWCMTALALMVLAATALSAYHTFGVIRAVPYPGGGYAPIHTTIEFTDGGFFYHKAQGMTHSDPNGPYNVIGTHGLWRRTSMEVPSVSWGTEFRRGSAFIPGWLLVAPPGLMALVAWMPAVAHRLRRKPFQCACGYDRRGLAADAPCPECGTTPTRG
jgi:hypothetical protein